MLRGVALASPTHAPHVVADHPPDLSTHGPPDMTQQSETISGMPSTVTADEVRQRMKLEGGQRLVAVGGRHHRIAIGGETLLDHLDNTGLIIGHENLFCHR